MHDVSKEAKINLNNQPNVIGIARVSNFGEHFKKNKSTSSFLELSEMMAVKGREVRVSRV